MDKLIDIIIPAYNAHNTIDRAIASIVTQTLLDRISVTIVNDCSVRDYSDTINKFKDLVDIREITLTENVGCGYARQTGIDNTSAPFIVFVDADDMLHSTLSLSRLLGEFEANPELRVAFGSIMEYGLESGLYQQFPPNTWTWIFGNMYKRDFLEKNNVRFFKSSAGEDVGFNRIIKLLCMNEQHTISFIPDIIYLWTDANSANRINTYDFVHNTSKIGYIENIMYSHREVKKHQDIDFDILVLDAVVNLCELYFSYVDLVAYDERFVPEYLEAAKKYYNEIYKQYIPYITDELLEKVYYDNLFRLISVNGKKPVLNGVSFTDFVGMISGDN